MNSKELKALITDWRVAALLILIVLSLIAIYPHIDQQGNLATNLQYGLAVNKLLSRENPPVPKSAAKQPRQRIIRPRKDTVEPLNHPTRQAILCSFVSITHVLAPLRR